MIEKRVADVVTALVNGLRTDGASESHVDEMERVLPKFAAAFQTNIGNVSVADINDYLRGHNRRRHQVRRRYVI
jgi:hypothetical protein